MSNRRVFFAIYAVGLAGDGSTSYTPIHGLQSVGITTTFNLEQVFEIGQLNIYENIEGIPDIEVTCEKVLDGYIPIYNLATRTGSTSASLTGRQNARAGMAISIFGDTSDSASGTPLREVNMSGLYVSALSYNFPVDGNCTESVTFVGNHKLWKSTGFTFTGSLFTNQDQPLALTSGTGGVQRRENVKFGTLSDTLLPAGDFGGIPGISSSGTNDKTAGEFGAHLQGIRVSSNFGRTAINELGRRNPFYRYLELPVEVTTEVDVLSQHGDLVSATEDGVVPGSGTNLADKTIQVKLEEGLLVYLGTRNKLSNVSMTGGDTGGGNQTMTYTYTNFNTLTVTHPQDGLT
jgi:hypothetical protein